MDDVGDPQFRSRTKRFAERLVRRYAEHLARVAFGIDNEPGDGPIPTPGVAYHVYDTAYLYESSVVPSEDPHDRRTAPPRATVTPL
jgi:hypothetical protein